MLTSIRHGLVGWLLVPAIVAGFVVFGAISVIVIGIAETVTPDRRSNGVVALRRLPRSEEGDAD